MLFRTGILSTLIGVWLAAMAQAQTQFTINASQNVQAISPYIYGTNDPNLISAATNVRLGGNRWTAYNWENNDSNAGSDYIFQNDSYLSASTSPGAAVLPTLTAGARTGAATLLTIPINGYVSADRLGNGDVRYPNGDTSKPKLSQATILATRFVQEFPSKPGGPASFSLTPSTTDGAVYQDEFVNWVNHQTTAGQQVFYDLDNEPDLWSSTHAEVHPAAATYQELINGSKNYATAIKAVSPNALVFGGVNYGWGGYVNLQGASDQSTDSTITTKTLLNFQAAYLKQMHAADVAAGKRLVDVLDMHWYPEAVGTNGIRITGNDNSAASVAARVQAARSLWDPTYTYNTNPALGENSWITRDSLPYQPAGTPAPFNTTAIQLLPREKWLVNQYDPGMKLSLSEYEYGGGADISGGIAEADALGVFGQQGLFAANWWSDGSSATFTNSAFNMYLNYDGKGHKFGNTSIGAATNSNSTTAVYASEDAGNPNRMVLVLINRTGAQVTSTLNIANSSNLSLVNAYQLTSASSNIAHVVYNPGSPQWQWLGTNQLSYNLPAMSVTTLVLVKAQLGDFNLDGVVTNTDIQAMISALASPIGFETANNLTASNLLTLGDFNGDGALTAKDVQGLMNYLAGGNITGNGGGSTQAVPEPSTLLLLSLGGILLLIAPITAIACDLRSSHPRSSASSAVIFRHPTFCPALRPRGGRFAWCRRIVGDSAIGCHRTARVLGQDELR